MGQAGDLEDELARRKELKVHIPLDLYMKLHQHKILNGALLSEVVVEALRHYLKNGDGDEEKGESA